MLPGTDAGAAAPVGGAARATPTGDAREILEKLRQLVEDHDSEALRLVVSARDELASALTAPTLEEVSAHLKVYDFKAAREALAGR